MNKNFTKIRDQDREILFKLEDDKELLQVCSLSKYTLSLCNEDFFHNRMKQKYPEVKKPENMTWKNFFLQTVYYVAKLKEEFNFVFLPTSDDPKGYYKLLQENKSKQYMLEFSAIKSWLDMIKYLLHRPDEGDELELDYVIISASRGNDSNKTMKIIKYLSDYVTPAANDIDVMFLNAASKGNMQLIKYLESFNPDYNFGLQGAAENGNSQLIEYFIGKGANDWAKGIYGAAYAGREDLVFNFISRKPENLDLNKALFFAGKSGNELLVQYFYDLGATDINLGLVGAAMGNHKKLVDKFIKLGADNWHSAKNATKPGSEMYQFFSDLIERDM